MDSFTRYAERARTYASGAVRTIGDEDTQKWVLGAIIIPAALFVILSPGLILNLPRNPKGRCEKLVPLPTSATGSCNGATYVVGTNDDLTAPQGAPICKARNDCNGFWTSGYTSRAPIFVHAFVFVLLATIVGMFLRRQGLAK